MKLTDISPTESKLKLKNVVSELTLRPINLADEVWLANKFGEDGIAKIFTQMDLQAIAEIVWHQLNAESRSNFKKKTVTFIGDTGEELEWELGGIELFYHTITGAEDKLAIINAILDNLNLSRPEVKDEPVEVKKKTQKK